MERGAIPRWLLVPGLHHPRCHVVIVVILFVIVFLLLVVLALLILLFVMPLPIVLFVRLFSPPSSGVIKILMTGDHSSSI